MVRRILDLRASHRTPSIVPSSRPRTPARPRTSFLSPATGSSISHPPVLQMPLPPLSLPISWDWLAHPAYDDYWKRLTLEDRYSDFRVPALQSAAWHDIFLGGTLRNYSGIKAHAGTDEARQGQHLLVAIGGHAGEGRKIGDIDFGLEAAKYNENDTTLRWYDFLSKVYKTNSLASTSRFL